MIEIRIHARAGQGAITTGIILAGAAFKEGTHAYAFPYFGAARMGAAMNAFVRLDDKPIRARFQIHEPNVLLVMDPTLMRTVDMFEGIRPNGLAVINQPKDVPVDGAPADARVVCVPGDDIAESVFGRRIGNTAILGAYAAASGDITLESLQAMINDRFPEKLASPNCEAARLGFEAATNGVAK